MVFSRLYQFKSAKNFGWGQKIALGLVLLPVLIALTPLIIFLVYQARKMQKELISEQQKQAARNTETIRVTGEVIDIPSPQHIEN